MVLPGEDSSMSGLAAQKANHALEVEIGLRAHVRQRPTARLSDIWKAPLHDLPVRDELLYQYLPLSAGMKVLEIGPGSGFTAFRLSRQVNQLVLQDVSPGNIDRLKRDLHELSNVSFACADACSPGLPDVVGTGFDAVIGIEVFEYILDPGTCLKNLADVLKPGGCLFLQWPNYPLDGAGGVTWFRSRREIDCLMEAARFTSWDLYSLQLNSYAGAIFRIFHEAPLRWYRRNRQRTAAAKPRTFDETWAFRSGHQLAPYRFILHSAWALFSAMMRVGGDCFQRSPVESREVNRNLLLIAFH
jgi:SAM-dependent methyltransferase